MRHQKGFAIIELVLGIIVLAVLLFFGVYAWQHSKKPATQVDTLSQTHPGVWITYNSSHSPLHFAYPSDWQLVQNTVSGEFTLEDVSIKGPNSFVMRFILEKNHVNTYGQCVLDYYGPNMKLNDSYTVASNLNITNSSEIDSLALISTSTTSSESKSGCPPDMSGLSTGTGMNFTFEAWYTTSDGKTYAPKASGNYFTLPEVQTAKTIFGSVQA